MGFRAGRIHSRYPVNEVNDMACKQITITRPSYPRRHITPVVYAPISWWTEVPQANQVLFAYDANADSYAASKVNRVNPGTYDLYEFAGDPEEPGSPYPRNPAWDGLAWEYIHDLDATLHTACFLNGYARSDNDHNWTLAIRAKMNADEYFCYLINAGCGDISLTSSVLVGNVVNGYHFSMNQWSYAVDPKQWHVYVLSGWDLYIDGVLAATITGDTDPYNCTGNFGNSNILQFGAELLAFEYPYVGSPIHQYADGGTSKMNKMIGIDSILTDVEASDLSTLLAA